MSENDFSNLRVVIDPAKCYVCGSRTSSLCSGCSLVFFCSRECLMLGWRTHKPICPKMNEFYTVINFDIYEIEENADPFEVTISKNHSTDQIAFKKNTKLKDVKKYICEHKELEYENMVFVEQFEKKEFDNESEISIYSNLVKKISSADLEEKNPNHINLSLINVGQFYALLVREGILKNRHRFFEHHYFEETLPIAPTLVEWSRRLDENSKMKGTRTSEFGLKTLIGYINARRMYFYCFHNICNFLPSPPPLSSKNRYNPFDFRYSLNFGSHVKSVIIVMNKLAVCSYNLDLVDEALWVCQKLIKFLTENKISFRNSNNKQRLGTTYFLMAKLYVIKKDFERGKLFKEKALKFPQRFLFENRKRVKERELKNFERKMENERFDERFVNVKGYRALRRIKILNLLGMSEKKMNVRDSKERINFLRKPSPSYEGNDSSRILVLKIGFNGTKVFVYKVFL